MSDALRALPARCWELHGPQGPIEYGEGVPHHDSYEEAIVEAKRRRRDWDITGPAWPVRLPVPCWTVRCGSCGERLHEDYGLHAPSREGAIEAAEAYEWRMIDGVPYCTDGPDACWHHAEEGIGEHPGAGSTCQDPACREAYGA